MFNSIQSRTLAVSGAALPSFLSPILLSGTETLGRLFEYTLQLKTPDALAFSPGEAANVDLDKLVGTEVTVSIELEGNGTFIAGVTGDGAQANVGAGVREITGLVVTARIVREEGRSIVYELVLRPWLYLATLNQDSRLFQNMDVIEITDAVLSAYVFPVEKRLYGPISGGGYPKRDIQRQCWESDFGFLCRLWEEWGIWWWIEHGDGRHRLVLCDAIAGHHAHGEAYRTIRYLAPNGKRADEEHIHALSVQSVLTTGKVASVDYDYSSPGADLAVHDEAPRDTAQANQECYAWGDYSQPRAGHAGLDGEHNNPLAEARHLARVRIEAKRCAGRRATGKGNLRGLTTGQTFTLTHYPQQAANCEYLVVSCTLLIEEIAEASGTAQRYRCAADFEIHPANEPFRLPADTPKPRVAGPEVATVVGPPDQEIWIDAYGRVKVQFVWDRLGRSDQNSSCWVRVSSLWQGDGFGAIQPPRIGQEVQVGYLNGGDPDLPIIVGRAVNEFNKPPWKLPANQALTGLRSRELGGSSRANQLVLDDTAGAPQAQLSSDFGYSQLNLGSITRIPDNGGRKDARGHGFELRSDQEGVIRAGGGMVVTTEARPNAQSYAKDIGETLQRLAVAHDQQDTYATLAREQQAQERGDQDEVAKALLAQHDEICGHGAANAQAGEFPELAAPHLLLAGAAGIATTTPYSTHLASGEHLALTAGGHLGISVGKRLLAGIARGVRICVQSCGWRLVAMSGDIELSALKDNLKLLAKLDISATANRITISAKEELVISGGGSATQYNSGGITHSTAGGYTVHASGFTFSDPRKQAAVFPAVPKSGNGNLELFNTYAIGRGVASDFQVEDALGRVVTGALGAKGYAAVSGLAPGPVQVAFDSDKAEPWAAGSYVRKMDWPEDVVDDVAGPEAVVAQARDVASRELVGPGLDAKVGQVVGQLAGVFKGGRGDVVNAGLSSVEALLGATGVSRKSAAVDVRTPGFV